MEKAIRELRLIKGLTIQAASNLSKISVARIKRWESNGGGNSDSLAMCGLLHAYGFTLDDGDFFRIPTQREVLEAILSSACEAMANGKIHVDMNKVISLMAHEGFDVSELQAVFDQKKAKRSTAAVTA
jgi:transcriptional regulator with XRE-family HTH domain